MFSSSILDDDDDRRLEIEVEMRRTDSGDDASNVYFVHNDDEGLEHLSLLEIYNSLGPEVSETVRFDLDEAQITSSLQR